MYRDGTGSGGRPKGAVNQTTRSIQLFCRSVMEDPQYRETVLQRARTGTLGAMEPVILAYAYGKPKESIDLRFGPIEEDLSLLSVEELAQRAADLVAQLDEAKALAEALPAVCVNATSPAAQPAAAESCVDIHVEAKTSAASVPYAQDIELGEQSIRHV